MEELSKVGKFSLAKAKAAAACYWRHFCPGLTQEVTVCACVCVLASVSCRAEEAGELSEENRARKSRRYCRRCYCRKLYNSSPMMAEKQEPR